MYPFSVSNVYELYLKLAISNSFVNSLTNINGLIPTIVALTVDG
jgi:hypothetical protein